jgi:hypothetical protein
MRLLTALALCAVWAETAAAANGKTFRQDAWPVLQRHCTGCHQPGEIGPMPLTNYREARPWAKAIREAVLRRSMPPWHATPGVHAFRNDRSLSQAEIDAVVGWVDGGAPEGSGGTAPLTVPARAQWTLGKPDRVVRVPGFRVPKSGTVPYSFLIVPLGLDHDTWVRAAEFRIDRRAVIHHINAFVRAPGSSYLAGFPANQIFVPTVAERQKRRDGERVFDRRQLLQGYEPGYTPAPWLDDGAKLVPAGADLIFEMHYSPNGTEAVDYSEFGLYFATARPAKRVLAIDTLRDLDLAIPPGAAAYESSAAMTVATPVRLLSIQPHMHLRGKAMKVRAVYPDGRREDLIDVPRYDFNWQTTYFYRDPLPLPKGTRLESVARFDNSANNPFNPAPGDTVHWGDQTSDEMHIAFLELVLDAGGDPESLLETRPRMVGESPK